MCLYLKNNSVLQTASEDIVVYKILRRVKYYLSKNIQHGSSFTGIIKNVKCR